MTDLDDEFNKPILKLTGVDGNAFAIIGQATKVLRKAGMSETYVAEFIKEATAGSYDELLQVMFKYFEVR